MGKFKEAVILAGTVLCICFGMTTAVSAEPKAGAANLEDSDYLRYVAEGLNWDENGIILSGYFVNISSDRDVYGLTNGALVINDAAGTPAISTSLNSGSLGEVSLGPGERWDYSVEREIANFDPDAYNVRTFSTSVSCDFSISNHTETSLASERGETVSFVTVDNMSEEEWQQLLAKLKSAMYGNGSDQKTSVTYDVPAYTPTYESSKLQKSTCRKCLGAGSLICEKCNGIGYKMVRTRVDICLVLHHSDCPAWNSSSAKCNGCHNRNDYYDHKENCIYCNGKGRRECSLCFGAGKR